MVEGDGRDGAGRRHDDVRGVEPAAEPHLQHDRVAPAASEVFQRDRGDELEGRRMHVDRCGRIAHGARDLIELPVGDVDAVHLDALVETQNERRGEKPRIVAGRLQDAGYEGAGGTFAVRAGDMHDRISVLRIAERGEQRARAVEPEVHVAPRSLLQIGLGVESVIGRGAFRLRRRAFLPRHATPHPEEARWVRCPAGVRARGSRLPRHPACCDRRWPPPDGRRETL